MKTKSEEFKKIESKIKKLLALATSDNQYEAEAAMRQAMKLMAKHQINEHDLNDVDIITREYVSDYTKPPHFMRELYNGVSYAFGVYCVRCNGYNGGSARIMLTGLSQDVERAMYMFVVAYNLIEAKGKEYAKSRPTLSRTAASDYRTGLAAGFVSNLIKAYATEEKAFSDETGTSLVCVDLRRSDAKSFFAENSDLKVVMVTERIRNNVHSANGFQDGQEIRVSQGIKTDGNQTLALKGY